jgi:hypothetical protein
LRAASEKQKAKEKKSMKTVRYFSAVAATVMGVIMLSPLLLAQEVHTDYDKHANFSQYKTYYWEKVQTTNPLWQQRIQDAVDKDLQAKGWQRAQSDGDIALTAVGSARDQHEYETFYNGLGGWRWRGFGEETTTVSDYKVGSLILDMYDSKTKQLVWRGTSSDTLSDKVSKNEKERGEGVKPPPRCFQDDIRFQGQMRCQRSRPSIYNRRPV